MKQIYAILAVLGTYFMYGQASDLYFSKYGEGSSNNKFLEIYNGTGADVDLSIYSVELYANGSSSATNTLALSGILAAGDVYVIANSGAAQDILDVADTTSTVTYFNGDDAVALLKNGAPLDVIGEIGVDPGSGWTVAGVSNATKDHTLIRKSSVCDPTTDWALSAGTNADDSQWIVLGQDDGWDLLGSHTGCTAQPELTILSPSEGEVFNPETDEVTVEFQVNNFQVDQPNNGDGYIVYALDGTESDYYTDDPITLTGLSQGQHEFWMKLVDNSGNDLNPPVADTVHFEIATYTQVADLSELRAGNLDGYYEVTGEVYYIGGEDFGYAVKAFVQDNTAGIMIFDRNSYFDLNNYNLYDGITGLKGQLTEYRGVLELIPTVAAGVPSSTGNTVNPQTVSIADYNANHDDYESMLVQFDGVTIATNDTVFELNTNYDVVDAVNDTTTLRVIFSALAGDTIPTIPVSIIAIGGEYNGNPQIYPRDANDIFVNNAININSIAGLNVYPNPVYDNTVYIASDANTEKHVRLLNMTGQTVWETTMRRNGKLILPVKNGVYLMQIEENGSHATVKLIVK